MIELHEKIYYLLSMATGEIINNVVLVFIQEMLRLIYKIVKNSFFKP